MSQPRKSVEAPRLSRFGRQLAEGIPPRQASWSLPRDRVTIDFRYGGPFTRADERASPPVPAVVLSDVLNQQLYAGADSVGRTMRIAGRASCARPTHRRPGATGRWPPPRLRRSEISSSRRVRYTGFVLPRLGAGSARPQWGLASTSPSRSCGSLRDAVLVSRQFSRAAPGALVERRPGPRGH
jgi:hypothetical protein